MLKRKRTSDQHALHARPGTYVLSVLPLGVLAGATIIAAVVFMAYIPAINGGFVLDDDIIVTENKIMKAPNGLYRFWCTAEEQDYWPMTYTTLWIEWRMWERNSTGYHVTNLILHVVESLLIWVILRKLSIPGAFLAALLFAVHPVNVESVAWISQRKNTMAMLFFLLSILWYVKSDEKTPGASSGAKRVNVWYWLSLAAFVLAMLSKGSVAVLPLVLLGIVWWMRPLTRRDLVQTAPFFVVAAVLAAVNVWFQSHGTTEVFRTAGLLERLLGAGGVIWFYLYKALLPFDLAFIYPQWHIEAGNPLWWLPLIGALIVTAMLWRYRNGWSRPLLFAWGFFCVTLLPVMGFTDIGFMRYSLVADHYQHIAIIGVIALIAAGFCVLRQRLPGKINLAATTVAILVVGVLALLTWRQCKIYSDEITLYNATLEKNPDCWLVHSNLGFILAQAGQPQQAIEQFRQAVRSNPKFSVGHNNLGNLLFNKGEVTEAVEHLQEALRLKSDYPEAYYNLGTVYIRTGRPNQAIEYYEQALRLKPDYVEAQNDLGVALKQTGRIEEAIKHYRQALSLKPDFTDAYYNLALAHAELNQSAEAIASARKALELARIQGRTNMAKLVEDWLKSFQGRGKE